MAFLQDSDRLQMRMNSLEDMIAKDHPVRFLEAFVEKVELFLGKGFYVQKAQNKSTKPRISIGQFLNHKKNLTKPPKGDSPLCVSQHQLTKKPQIAIPQFEAFYKAFFVSWLNVIGRNFQLYVFSFCKVLKSTNPFFIYCRL